VISNRHARSYWTDVRTKRLKIMMTRVKDEIKAAKIN